MVIEKSDVVRARRCGHPSESNHRGVERREAKTHGRIINLRSIGVFDSPNLSADRHGQDESIQPSFIILVRGKRNVHPKLSDGPELKVHGVTRSSSGVLHLHLR